MYLFLQAGLPLIDGQTITWEIAKSHNIIGKRLANQKPLWEPGMITGIRNHVAFKTTHGDQKMFVIYWFQGCS